MLSRQTAAAVRELLVSWGYGRADIQRIDHDPRMRQFTVRRRGIPTREVELLDGLLEAADRELLHRAAMESRTLRRDLATEIERQLSFATGNTLLEVDFAGTWDGWVIDFEDETGRRHTAKLGRRERHASVAALLDRAARECGGHEEPPIAGEQVRRFDDREVVKSSPPFDLARRFGYEPDDQRLTPLGEGIANPSIDDSREEYARLLEGTRRVDCSVCGALLNAECAPWCDRVGTLLDAIEDLVDGDVEPGVPALAGAANMMACVADGLMAVRVDKHCWDYAADASRTQSPVLHDPAAWSAEVRAKVKAREAEIAAAEARRVGWDPEPE